MPRRFTDTAKWEDPWFSELTGEVRFLWLYLLDACDHAGIWKANRRHAEFCLGMKVDWPKAEEALKDRIYKNGEYWFIPKFLKFQYGAELNRGDAAKGAIRRVKERGFLKIAADVLGDSPKRLLGLSQETPKSPTATAKAMAKAKEVKKLEEGAEETKPYKKPDPINEPIGALVMHYKIISGAAWDDRDWDKRFWGRNAEQAKVILDAIGGFNDAVGFIDFNAKKFNAAKCKWTLRTIADRAVEWKSKERARYDAASRKGFRRTDVERGADQETGKVGELSPVGPLPDALRNSAGVQDEHSKND